MLSKTANTVIVIVLALGLITQYCQISKLKAELKVVQNTVNHLVSAMSDTCDRVGYLEHMLEVE